jgi:hypothetical protein
MRALSVANLTDADGALGGPLPMSACGTKQTSILTLNMSAFGGKADIPDPLCTTTDPRKIVASGNPGWKLLLRKFRMSL